MPCSVFVSWGVTSLAAGFVDSAVGAPSLLVVFSARAPQASAEWPWLSIQVPVGEVRALSPPVPDAVPVLSLSHRGVCHWTPAPQRLEAPGGQRVLVPGTLSAALAPEAWPLAERGRWAAGCLLGSHCSLSFRSPAAGAAVLHRPRRTRHESCRESHGDGFPGSTQLTPGERALPPAPFLLQHAPTPLRTGGEGQVAGCCPEPAWAALRTQRSRRRLPASHQRWLPEQS